ncbi:hypothetical protein V5O48_009843 [Marasmius crinis-equi]|uniref:DUF6532 domain-containing protein n=1 Tax=Marasmius crinis-equi TaxID=585013 RepID=A0ABR3FA64_9AGAR
MPPKGAKKGKTGTRSRTAPKPVEKPKTPKHKPSGDVVSEEPEKDSANDEVVLPPRRRPRKTTVDNDTGPMDVDSATRVMPERGTKNVAIEVSPWMDAGCRKGKGATAAHNALKRERALSSAEQASKAKKAKAALDKGEGIPRPSGFYDLDFASDDDLIMDAVVTTKSKQVKPTLSNTTSKVKQKGDGKRKEPPASKSTSKQLATSSVVPTKRQAKFVPKQTAIDIESDSSEQGLDEMDQDSDHGSDGEFFVDGEDDEDEEAEISPDEFSYEQATVLRSSKSQSASRLFDDDEDNVDIDDVSRPSSPPPLSNDSDSGTEGVESVVPERKPSSRSAAAKHSGALRAPLKTPSNAASQKTAKTPSRDVKRTERVDMKAPGSPKTGVIRKDVNPDSSGSSQQKRHTKRSEAHMREQTHIKTSKKSEDQARTWSVAATPVANARGNYALGCQPKTLQEILECAMALLLEFSAFKTLYPKYTKPGHFVQNFFLRASQTIGRSYSDTDIACVETKEIYERFDRDPRFVQNLAHLATTRFIQFRSGSRNAATTVVSMNYDAETSDGIQKEIDGDAFVCDRTEKASIMSFKTFHFKPDVQRPYLHKAIKNVCRVWLMNHNGSTFNKFQRKFTKLATDKDGNQRSEGELSIPIVAAAAAAVHVRLEELKTGTAGTPAFNEEGHRPYYEHHVQALEDIQTERPDRFHAIMSELYTYTRTRPTQIQKRKYTFDEAPSEGSSQNAPGLVSVGGNSNAANPDEDVVTEGSQVEAKEKGLQEGSAGPRKMEVEGDQESGKGRKSKSGEDVIVEDAEDGAEEDTDDVGQGDVQDAGDDADGEEEEEEEEEDNDEEDEDEDVDNNEKEEKARPERATRRGRK